MSKWGIPDLSNHPQPGQIWMFQLRDPSEIVLVLEVLNSEAKPYFGKVTYVSFLSRNQDYTTLYDWTEKTKAGALQKISD